MSGWFVAFLLESALGVLAAGWLLYVGYLSRFVGRRVAAEDSDPVLVGFRMFAMVAGPLLGAWVGWQIHREYQSRQHPFQLIWNEVSSKEGRFRVLLPEDPSFPRPYAATVAQVPYPFGEGMLTEYRYRASVSELGLLLTYRDLPDVLPQLDSQRILEDDLASQIERNHVKLLSRQPTRVSGRPGIRYKIQDPRQNFFIEGISVLDGQRIFQLAVQYANDNFTAENRERFFSSFEVLDEK